MRQLESLTFQHGGFHYVEKSVQPIQYAMENDLDSCEFSVIKYVSRHRSETGKGLKDLKKAIHFLQMLIEFHYNIVADVNFREPKELRTPPKETPLEVPLMQFKKDDPPSGLWTEPGFTGNQPSIIPIVEELPSFHEDEETYTYRVVPAYNKKLDFSSEDDVKSGVIGYRVALVINDGSAKEQVFFIRHYMADLKIGGEPTLNWCFNAAERQAVEFTKKGLIPSDFNIFKKGTSGDYTHYQSREHAEKAQEEAIAQEEEEGKSAD